MFAVDCVETIVSRSRESTTIQSPVSVLIPSAVRWIPTFPSNSTLPFPLEPDAVRLLSNCTFMSSPMKAVATNDEHRGVQLELRPDHIRFTVATEDGCAAHAEAPAVFHGGGDRRILTLFFAPFLIEAARSLRGPKIVFDVAQNRLDKVSDAVRSCPALMYGADDASTRWVVMPVSLGLKPSPETLGSNYEPMRRAAGDNPAHPVEAA